MSAPATDVLAAIDVLNAHVDALRAKLAEVERDLQLEHTGRLIAEERATALEGVIRRYTPPNHVDGDVTRLPCNESCVDCTEEVFGAKHRADLGNDACASHPLAEGNLVCWRCAFNHVLATAGS